MIEYFFLVIILAIFITVFIGNKGVIIYNGYNDNFCGCNRKRYN